MSQSNSIRFVHGISAKTVQVVHPEGSSVVWKRLLKLFGVGKVATANCHTQPENQYPRALKTAEIRKHCLEELESRLVPSAVTSDLSSGGRLLIEGSGLSDMIDVRKVGESVLVKYVTRSGSQIVSTNTSVFLASQVSSLKVEGLVGGSTVRISSPDRTANFTVDVDAGIGDNAIEVENLDGVIHLGTGNDNLYGNGGTLTLDCSGAHAAVNVDLLQRSASIDGLGTVSQLQGIESVIGSNLDGDVMQGDGATNTLRAGAGATTIHGGSGNTTIYGGSGKDRLIAGSGSDVIYGGSGDATFVPGGGTDIMVGGSGVNTLDFSGAIHTDGFSGVHGVTIDMINGTATGYGTVSFSGIHNAVGSDGDDTFYLSTHDKVRGGLGYNRFFVNGNEVVINGQNLQDGVDPTGQQAFIDLFNRYSGNITDLLDQTWNQFQLLYMQSRSLLTDATQKASLDSSFGRFYANLAATPANGLLNDPRLGLNLSGNPLSNTPFDPNTWTSPGDPLSGVVTGLSHFLSNAGQYASNVVQKFGHDAGIFLLNALQGVGNTMVDFADNLGKSVVDFGVNLGSVLQDPRADVAFARFVGAFGVLARELVVTVYISPIVDIASNVVGQLLGQIAGRDLSQGEKDVASAVFGGQIPLWRVKIVTDSSYINTIGGLLGFSGQTNGSVVFLGSVLPTPFSYTGADGQMHLSRDSTDSLGPDLITTFVHEMTHVFQKYTEAEGVSGEAVSEAFTVSAEKLNGIPPIPPNLSTTQFGTWLESTPVDPAPSQYSVTLTGSTQWRDLANHVEEQARAVETFFGFLEVVEAINVANNAAIRNFATAYQVDPIGTLAYEILSLNPNTIPNRVGAADMRRDLFDNPRRYAEAFLALQNGRRSNGFPALPYFGLQPFPAWDNYFRVMGEAGLFFGNPIGFYTPSKPFSWQGYTATSQITSGLGLTDIAPPTGYRIKSFDTATGQVTFANDQGGTQSGSLRLWEVNGYLASNATNGDYADPTDVDPGPGIAHIRLTRNSSIVVDAGNWGDTVDVSGLTDCGVTFVGGAGNDTFVGSSVSTSLGDIVIAGSGFFTLHGGSGNDFIQAGSGLDDIDGGGGANTISYTMLSGDTYISTYVNNDVILGAGDGRTTGLYGALNVENVRITAAGGPEDYLVRGTGNGSKVVINDNTGSDAYYLGYLDHTLDGIQGSLTLNGLGTDVLLADDSKSITGNKYTVTTSTLDRTQMARLTYIGIHSFVLDGSAGVNTYEVNSTGAGTTNIQDGDSGSQFIINGDGLTGVNSFDGNGGDDIYRLSVASAISASSLEISGGSGNDSLSVTGTSKDDAVTLALLNGVGNGAIDGLGTTIGYDTLERFAFDGNGGVNSLRWVDATNTMHGSAINPQSGVVFRPIGVASGEVSAVDLFPFVSFTNVKGDFTVNGDANGGSNKDTLVVLGTSTIGLQSSYSELTSSNGSDVIKVSDSSVTIDNAADGELRGVQLEYNRNVATFKSLLVRGGSETLPKGDIFEATPSNRLNILLDGMDPKSGIQSDRLSVTVDGSRSLVKSMDSANGPPHVRIVQDSDGASVGFIHVENVDGVGAYVAGSGGGTPAEVQVFDPTSRKLRYPTIRPFAGFTGGVRVTTGDVNGDGVPDIIVGAGPGGGPRVEVFDGVDGSLITSFMAFNPAFTGGVSVASGDTNGDGFAEIVVAAGAGGGPNVKVFDGATGALLKSFFAFSPTFTGGVHVAVGDVNGDGYADIILGAGVGGAPHIRVLNGHDYSELYSFYAYSAGFQGGVYVSAGDLNGDGYADVVTGAGNGGGPQVRAFDLHNGDMIADFMVNDPNLPSAANEVPLETGISVAVVDLDGDGVDDILTGKGQGSRSILRGYRVAQQSSPTSPVVLTGLTQMLYNSKPGVPDGSGVFVGD